MRLNHKNKLIAGTKLTKESRELISFYTLGDRIKTDYSVLQSIFPIIKRKHTKKNMKKVNNKTKIRSYFNNIDTCQSNPRMKQRDTMIKILKKLGKEHKNILEKIFIDFNFDITKRLKISKFVGNDIYKLSFEKCVEWLNLYGIELLRAIYIFYLDRKLPDDIVKLLGYYPHVRGEFTSLDIQNEIDIGLKRNKKVQIEKDGIVLDLLVFSDNMINLSELFLERCFYMDKILKKANLNRRKKINLEIWLSNKTKDLPPSRDIKYIGPKEVNSGCNTYSSEGNRVSVWRKEEFPKVLIHELIHSLGLEKHNDYGEVKDFIYRHFDVSRNNMLNVFECYVELMAEMINIILLVRGRGKFQVLINLELEHCLFQVGKILNYFGYSSWEDFYREGGWIETDKTGKYQQRSNVFSYFIFRSLVMYNLDDFVDLCSKKNKRHFLKQDFNSSELLDIVKKTLKDNSYKNKIDSYIEENSRGDRKKLVFNNLRMTCVEGQLI